MKTIEERFFSKVEKTGKCWTWVGNKNWNGYGIFLIAGKKFVRAHRWSYEYVNGPIPKGLFACHKCDNPGCVNPKHIFIGTHKDNMQDALKKGRMKGMFERKAHCIKGHPLSGDNLRVRPNGEKLRYICITCRRKFNREHERKKAMLNARREME